jgi:hypothetical protein
MYYDEEDVEPEGEEPAYEKEQVQSDDEAPAPLEASIEESPEPVKRTLFSSSTSDKKYDVINLFVKFTLSKPLSVRTVARFMPIIGILDVATNTQIVIDKNRKIPYFGTEQILVSRPGKGVRQCNKYMKSESYFDMQFNGKNTYLVVKEKAIHVTGHKTQEEAAEIANEMVGHLNNLRNNIENILSRTSEERKDIEKLCKERSLDDLFDALDKHRNDFYRACCFCALYNHEHDFEELLHELISLTQNLADEDVKIESYSVRNSLLSYKVLEDEQLCISKLALKLQQNGVEVIYNNSFRQYELKIEVLVEEVKHKITLYRTNTVVQSTPGDITLALKVREVVEEMIANSCFSIA